MVILCIQKRTSFPRKLADRDVTLQLRTISLALILSAGLACSESPRSNHASAPKEKDRPVSQYTAKQAFARLVLHLRSQGRTPVEKLWYVAPDSSSVQDEGRSLLVGAWALIYEDSVGKKQQASLNCWGEVEITDAPAGLIGSKAGLSSPIQTTQWVLDSLDAIAIAVGRGASWHANLPIGGVLLTLNIKGRGARPVWGGMGSVALASNAAPEPIWIDAQTAELYRVTEREEYVPISSLANRGKDWPGSFDQTSDAALVGRLRSPDWWPRAYFQAESGGIAYNRALLSTELNRETVKSNRDAASWQTSGTIEAALGDWLEAADDLDQTVKMQPTNDWYRLERAIVYTAIRDFDSAAADLRAVSPTRKELADDAFRTIEILKGNKGEIDRKSDSAFGGVMKTPIGSIPIEVPIGPVPIAASNISP